MMGWVWDAGRKWRVSFRSPAIFIGYSKLYVRKSGKDVRKLGRVLRILDVVSRAPDPHQGTQCYSPTFISNGGSTDSSPVL
jgi:hypothetical protein